jgi:hypothetical protein
MPGHRQKFTGVQFRRRHERGASIDRGVGDASAAAGRQGRSGTLLGVPAIKRDGAEGGGVASDGQRMRRQRTERRNACGSKSFESKGTALSKVGR